jgi:uncharacterized membrane protein YeaQ/YmgE (transglycosylase-associated protein family)
MHFLWIILIGFIAGLIAKLVTPGENEPKGFILTTALGIIGAFVATYLGQAIGLCRDARIRLNKTEYGKTVLAACSPALTAASLPTR